MYEIPRDSDWKRLKAENERLKAKLKSMQFGNLPPHPARDLTAECNDLLAAKDRRIAELEQDATALHQLEELLRDGWLITCEYGPFWITNRDYDTHDPYPTLPAAIAAAWERSSE